MTPISVVIITFNEEKNIERCILSVKDIADEIVVVDSFSKDKTPEICKKYKVKFVQHVFDGHIEQKNWAITQAKYPHILSLDADEAPDDQLKNEILKIKKNWDADGYSMNRLTNYCGKWIRHSGWYPDKKLRLWDSRKGSWGGVNPHDKYIMEKNASIRHLKGNLLHYSFYSIDQHIAQINKFSLIKAQMAINSGKKSNIIKILFHPFFKFIRDYFFKFGFLDGFYGLVICMNSAHSNFLKYSKMYSIQKEKQIHK